MIFGNKDDFAIEVLNPSKAKGEVYLWIKDNMLGSAQEKEYLRHVYLQLLNLNNIRMESCIFKKCLLEVDIDQLIEEEEVYLNQKILSLGESFDDFNIRVLGSRDCIAFYWKIVDKPFFDYPSAYCIKDGREMVLWDAFNKAMDSFRLIL